MSTKINLHPRTIDSRSGVEALAARLKPWDFRRTYMYTMSSTKILIWYGSSRRYSTKQSFDTSLNPAIFVIAFRSNGIEVHRRYFIQSTWHLYYQGAIRGICYWDRNKCKNKPVWTLPIISREKGSVLDLSQIRLGNMLREVTLDPFKRYLEITMTIIVCILRIIQCITISVDENLIFKFFLPRMEKLPISTLTSTQKINLRKKRARQE